jgi:hypothetical protein
MRAPHEEGAKHKNAVIAIQATGKKERARRKSGATAGRGQL